MDLNNSEQTLKKNLLMLGLNVGISNYDQMITYIKNKVVIDLINSIKNDKIEESLTKIFGKYGLKPSISCLIDSTEIDVVSDSYIFCLIESGYLREFIREEQQRISKATEINAFKLILLKKIKSEIDPIVFGIFLHFIKNETSYFSLISKVRTNIGDTSFLTSSSSYVKAESVPEENIAIGRDEKATLISDLIIVQQMFHTKIHLGYSRNSYSLEYWSGQVKNNMAAFADMDLENILN